MNEAPLRFADEHECAEFALLLERFAFGLRAFGIKDGPVLDQAVSVATRAAWLVLKRDEATRETTRARFTVVQ
jgi:hypothetical protein